MAVFLGVFVGAYLVLQSLWTGWNIWRSQGLEPVAVGKRSLGAGSTFRMFVAGDSAAAGLGATDFKTSFAGRIARHLALEQRVAYRNVSESGAKMADLLDQPLPEEPQDLVVLSAGSNDLLHFSGAKDLQRSTRRVLERYGMKGRQVVLIGPGMIHAAGADPLVLRPLHRLLRPNYVRALRGAAEGEGSIYVDPAQGVNELSQAEFEATVSEVDHFHLNNDGHQWWAQAILEELEGSRNSKSESHP